MMVGRAIRSVNLGRAQHVGVGNMSLGEQAGRVVIITGASGGLGFEAARVFAARGATVVLACRSAAGGESARARILAEQSRADVHVGLVDISLLSSVKAFAAHLAQQYPAIDVLINNAGIMATPHALTAEGFELQFATNHLGHFALTGLLLPLLEARPGGRVVAVSSIAARSGVIDFDDLMGERNPDPWKAYNQSKLANLLFARELQRRLSASARQTSAMAAHPGAATTNLFATPGGFVAKRILSPLLRSFLFHSAEEGVKPILFAATALEAQPGGYYGPQGYKEMKGGPGPALVPDQAKDTTTATRLWRVSENLTGVVYPFDAVG